MPPQGPGCKPGGCIHIAIPNDLALFGGPDLLRSTHKDSLISYSTPFHQNLLLEPIPVIPSVVRDLLTA